MTTKVARTREGWLRAMIGELRPWFRDRGYAIPPKVISVSVGWPGKGGVTGKVIGECWDPVLSEGTCHVFVSPMLEGLKLCQTLVHELLHAVLFLRHPDMRGPETPLGPGKHKVGHGPLFKKGCRALGLEGKPTGTHAGAELAKRLLEIQEALGPYPHTVLIPRKKHKKERRTLILVCRCKPRREFKGKKDDLRGPKVKCSGCGQRMRLKIRVRRPKEA